MYKCIQVIGAFVKSPKQLMWYLTDCALKNLLRGRISFDRPKVCQWVNKNVQRAPRVLPDVRDSRA